MKNKIINILIAGLLTLTVFSCRKSYLEKTDPTKINQDLFYRNQEEVEQAINGCYSQLQTISNNQWLFNEMITDNTTFDFNPDDRGQTDRMESYETWTYTSVNGNIKECYDLHYSAIHNINTALFRMQKATLTDSLRNIDEGQLKFMRAYLYFQLVQYFGDVILITQPIELASDAWSYFRKPQDSIYTQIEDDLKTAANGLPERYPAAHTGRATKGAALTLLGKMYLTTKKYTEAINALEQVLLLGYTLVPEYADVFDPQQKNGPESIFEIQYKGGADDLGEWSNFIYVFGPRLSGSLVTGFDEGRPTGWNTPTNDIIDAYESGDKRKAASVGLDFKSPVTNQVVPYIKKYQHSHAVLGRTDDNWPVLRYADALLMLAEAINEKEGATGEAHDYLNQVRSRAGLKAVAGLGQPAFREKVLHERRMELAFENWRWFDLKRTMTPQELTVFLNDYGAREKANPTVPRQGVPYAGNDYQFETFRILFPIPNDELIINKELGQNPGY